MTPPPPHQPSPPGASDRLRLTFHSFQIFKLQISNFTATATTTTAAAQRRLGGYDHGNGYDHDCCASTTAAITTLAMVTIAAAMVTIAEPMSVWSS